MLSVHQNLSQKLASRGASKRDHAARFSKNAEGSLVGATILAKPLHLENGFVDVNCQARLRKSYLVSY